MAQKVNKRRLHPQVICNNLIVTSNDSFYGVIIVCVLFKSHLKSTEPGNEIMDFVLAFLSDTLISKAEQVFGSDGLLISRESMIDNCIADVTLMFHASGNENYVSLFSVLLTLSFSLFSFS